MNQKKRGRRIFTYRARNRRIFNRNHPMRSALGTFLLLIAASALGFLGYNVIGPIVIRANQELENPTTTPDSYFTETTSTSAGIQTTTVTDITTYPASTTLLTTETTAETTYANRFGESVTVACCIKSDSLSDMNTFEQAAQQATENGYGAVILTMKDDTGKLSYASSVGKAMECGASSAGYLSAREIQHIAEKYHLDCIGIISTLKDQTYPNVFMDGSYTFKNGTTRWLDNKPTEGGKPWLSPFESAARAYLSDIALELSDAGFSEVLCVDTVFPAFFHSDTELLGNQIEDSQQRKIALVSVLNEMYASAASTCISVDLEKIANNTEEAYDLSMLKMSKAVINIQMNAMNQPFSIQEHRFDPTALNGADRIQMLLEAAREAAGNMEMIPCFTDPSLTDAQMEEIVATAQNAGFNRVLFQPREAITEE